MNARATARHAFQCTYIGNRYSVLIAWLALQVLIFSCDVPVRRFLDWGLQNYKQSYDCNMHFSGKMFCGLPHTLKGVCNKNLRTTVLKGKESQPLRSQGKLQLKEHSINVVVKSCWWWRSEHWVCRWIKIRDNFYPLLWKSLLRILN